MTCDVWGSLGFSVARLLLFACMDDCVEIQCFYMKGSGMLPFQEKFMVSIKWMVDV